MVKSNKDESATKTEYPDGAETVTFFPNCDALATALGLADKSLGGNRKVAVKASVLRYLISLALRSAPFDEGIYIGHNQDIKRAVDRKSIPNIRRHFEESGYFEHREAWPDDFDPQWYHSFYEDIRKSYEPHDTEGLRKHYKTNGQREFRAPNERAMREVNRWIKLFSE